MAGGFASSRARAAAWLALVAAGAAAPAAASDVQAGRDKARACAVCHGPLGVSTAPDAPNLAGQPAMYLAAQLRAYRSGARAHAVMAVIAKPLSDADISDLSAWFAAVRIEASAPP